MTPILISEMLEASNVEHCEQCHEQIIGEPPCFTDDFEEPLCSKGCLESWQDSQNERAFERFCEDFYGGSGPVTIQEQYQAASKEKYGI